MQPGALEVPKNHNPPMSVNNFKAIFTLLIFFIAEILVSFPVHIPIPARVTNLSVCLKPRRKHARVEVASSEGATAIPLNYVTAPVVAVLVLLATGCIHGEQVKHGIIGSGDGVEPSGIMVLFIGLAYMVLSVDRAGVLRFLAFWVASTSGSSGIRLYIAIYTFFFCVGTVIGNDPVILSGVPFLAYFTHETGINPPTAWIFSQFINANIASAVLVSSNLTNLVLSGAFSIPYFVYTSKIILPVLAAMIATLPTLLIVFRDPKYIPHKMQPITLKPRSALVDPTGGIFSSTILILTLCTLVATSTLHPPLYLVVVPPALMVLARDIAYDIWNHWKQKSEQEKAFRERRKDAANPLEGKDADTMAKSHHADDKPEGGALIDSEIPVHRSPTGQKTGQGLPINSSPKERPPYQEKVATHSNVTDTKALALLNVTGLAVVESHPPRANFFERTFPTVVAILKIMPFSLVLFSFSLFILVQGLAVTGWVDVWAGWWGAWAERTGPVGTVFGMGLVSCVLCNAFGTNIGATILLARVLQVWLQTSSPSPRLQDGAIYTLAIGSNYGAFTFSFPASLAGLLWRKLLLAKGINVHIGQFAKLNLLPCAVAMGVSCCVLVGEMYVIHR